MSRSNARSRSLRNRPSRSIAATIVALVLVALGVLVAICAISRLVQGSWPTQVTGAASAVASTTWGSAAVISVGAVLAVIGLVLLTSGIKPGAPTTAALSAPATSAAVGDTDFVISTRSLARLAAAGADQVDGVHKVSASASGRRVQLTVTTTSEQAAEIRQKVSDSVTERLSATGVQPVPRVSATVQTKGI